jgi:small subunit ribosomal protein S6
MAVFETVFIVRPNLSDDEVAKMTEKVKGLIEKHGGALLRSENWGKKKLAYEIKKEKKGTYVLLWFQGDGKLVSELERTYRIEDGVIKFITVRAPHDKLPPPAEERPAKPRDAY